MNQVVRKPEQASAVDKCPCCGQMIGVTADLRWNSFSRTLSGYGLVLVLSPHRVKIFDLMWNAWKGGVLISRDQMMSALYADDPNGGPDSDNIISVQINHTRKAIQPFGLSIKGRCGYQLVILKRAAA